MIVAIHQPNYLPYLGFFRKAALADVFVLYDTAQYSKNELHNRNRIKTPRGMQWLTVPVRRAGKRPIGEVEIAYETRWARRHIKALAANYRGAPHYEAYAPEIAAILSKDWTRLADLNTDLIARIARWLGLRTRFMRASELPGPPTQDPTEKIIHLTRAAGGDMYLSGPGGRDYLNPEKFREVGLRFSDFTARPYPQMYGVFMPNLSVVDALLNVGEATRDFLA